MTERLEKKRTIDILVVALLAGALLTAVFFGLPSTAQFEDERNGTSSDSSADLEAVDISSTTTTEDPAAVAATAEVVGRTHADEDTDPEQSGD